MKKYLVLILILAFSLIFLRNSRFSIHAANIKVPSLATNRIIVKFRPKTPPDVQNNLIKSFGIYQKEKLRLTDTFVLPVPEGRVVEFINKFLKNKNIEYAEEDRIATILEVPNDPYYPQQWGLSKIQAASAWNITYGLSSVDIAIVDTGIDGSHPDLSSKIVASADCTVSVNCTATSPFDNNGHGTHVAGIAAAVTNNGIGIAGTGYNTSLISVKVLDSSGNGYYSWVANGIVWAADHGAKVINLSLGGSSPSSTLSNAVSYAWNRGVVIAAAAGNDNTSRRLYPAYYSQVLSVAATDQTDQKAWFSNFGSWVKLAAPGVDIFSTYNNGDYTTLSGTSMATPFVSGVAGLVFGEHPTWTNSQVRDKIESTADKISGTGSYWQYGRINACSAVDCNTSINPTPTPTPTLTPIPTPTPTPTPTLTTTPTPTLTPTLSPTPTPIPRWCIRWPFLCR